MTRLPHKFKSLRNGQKKPDLVSGAGLSSGLIPFPQDLLHTNKERAESELGCSSIKELPPGAAALYVWADEVMKQIAANDAETPPKLRLAHALGILSDPKWSAKVLVSLRGSMPRHRVIARLARERIWATVWSLNWDRLLESALECVGFDREQQKRTQPWSTTYATVVTAKDFPKLRHDGLFCVLKPHGCVGALLQAEEALKSGDQELANSLSERFLICASELKAERNSKTDQMFFSHMSTDLHEGPLIIVGWSVSEPYLKAVINDSLENVVERGAIEQLSIIDIDFNTGGHKEITECYGLKKGDVFFGLEKKGDQFNIDAFFLWLQSLYCLDQLLLSADDEIKKAIEDRLGVLDKPTSAHFLFDWADDFLPAWVRMCWRAELVSCAGYRANELALDRPDEHIPWSIRGLPRPDLASAARLLSLLPTNGGQWNLSKFPGALWQRNSGRLVCPLPTWGPINELAALGPLGKSISEEAGYIQQIDILPLHYAKDTIELSPEELTNLKEKFSRVLSIPQFAQSRNIGVASDFAATGPEKNV